MNTSPYFTVIIPLYNKRRHITRAVDSILHQTVDNFEIIVVNDGSTDGGEEIVVHYNDGRIKLINQENAGAAAARNRGIELSRGEYVSFLDADDEWLPNHLEEIIQLIQKFPEAKAFSTSYKVRTKNKTYKKVFSTLSKHPWQGILENYFYTDMVDGNPMSTVVVCVKRDIFDEVGNFPVGIKIGEDVDMWIRIFLSYKVAFSTTDTAIVYVDADNRTIKTTRAPREEPIFVTRFQRMLDNNEVSEVFIDDVKKFIAHYLIVFASLNINVGDFKKANEFLNDPRTKILKNNRKKFKRFMFFYYLKNKIKDFLR